uniref:hypothetical protein n=1 Tax=Pararhizobium sp. IMCC3301 TaxID=3067904 RepID=UPI0027406B82|nr:hypothetical protein [Pararhizobium sp. IMCC3301]
MKQWKNPASPCVEAYIREQADTCKRRNGRFFKKLVGLIVTLIFLMIRIGLPAKIKLRMKDIKKLMITDS